MAPRDEPRRPGPRGPVKRWWPALAYAGAIFLLSSIEHPPPAPGALSDKHLHALLYAGFALTLLRGLAGRWARATPGTAGVAVALAVAYGATDEFHQRFVPGRMADAADLAADAAGAVAAALAALAWTRVGRARRGSRIDRAPGGAPDGS